MPPSWAMAMAVRASVTVSMAALRSGMLSWMCSVNRVETSVSRGRIDDSAGTSSTSSKVSPSGKTSWSSILHLEAKRDKRMGQKKPRRAPGLGGHLSVIMPCMTPPTKISRRWQVIRFPIRRHEPSRVAESTISGSCVAAGGGRLKIRRGSADRYPCMLSRIYGASLHGIDALKVTVEVDIASGLPELAMVGLPRAPCARARCA